MKIFFGSLSVIFIYGIISILSNGSECSDKNTELYQVHQPKMYLWVGLIDTILFGVSPILGVLMPDIFVGGTWWTTVGIELFALLGLYIIVSYFNCRIDIGEDEFVYHTFFGKNYSFQYSDIKRIRRTTHTIHMYTNKKHLYIDKHSNGVDEFMISRNKSMARRKHKSTK